MFTYLAECECKSKKNAGMKSVVGYSCVGSATNTAAFPFKVIALPFSFNKFYKYSMKDLIRGKGKMSTQNHY